MLDIHAIDWIAPLGLGAILAAAPFALALRVEKAAGHPWRALYSAIAALAWGWGTVSFANTLLDRAPAAIHSATIVELTGALDKDPAFSLRVTDAAPSLPLLEDLDVSTSRYASAKIGDRACVAIHPGWLGWRSAESIDCPPTR